MSILNSIVPAMKFVGVLLLVSYLAQVPNALPSWNTLGLTVAASPIYLTVRDPYGSFSM